MANLTTPVYQNPNASCASSSSPAAYSASTSSFSHYDVFINHRGPDSKKTLASHLYRRLLSSGLRVFLDREELVEGVNLTCQIKAAIRVASVQVAIFSPTYAESNWCLDELVLMVDSGATILPVFYNVKPNVLRWTLKNGAYAEALLNHQQKRTTDPQTGEEKPRYQSDTIKNWRKALAHVADISGFELNGDEGELVEKVVQSILKNVPKTPLDVAKYPTGLDLKLQEFEETVLSQQWETGRVEAKVVGIVGVGGVGKTTLAKQFFNSKRSYYHGSSFLFDVREDATRMPLNYLQSKLLKDLKQTDIMIGRDEGIGILKKHLSSCHVLIVLDDVDHVCQLEAFLPIKDILDPNSLILITSRDKHVLKSSGVLESSIYYLEGLNRPFSKELFCSYAFYHPLPPPEFADLVDRFVTVCHGLPLALKVLGALVCGENDERYWEEQLDRLQHTLPLEILERLRISYDSLSKEDQQIFLDIASFFIGEDRDTATRIWGTVGIQNLENKCLLEVDRENKIKMHDHIKELGRNIAADTESMPLRLWRRTSNEIDDLLDQSSCMMTRVRGITMVDRFNFYGNKFVFSMTETFTKSYLIEENGYEPRVINLRTFEIRSEYFTGMSSEMSLHMSSEMAWYQKWTDKVLGNCMRHLVNNSPTCGILNLRLIATEDGYLERILKRARSPHLLWLRWYKCPYSCLPSWIPMENLRVVEVAGLKLKILWGRESQVPFELRELNILAPLSSIPKSIGQLKLLEKIVIFHALLKTLPDEFCNLCSLKHLELRECSRMISLPDSFGKLTNLQYINLACASALHMLPLSFGKLIRLKHLDLRNCGNLTFSTGTPGNISMLEYLDLSNITTLEYMDLSGCKKVIELPSGIGDLYNLETLALGSHLLKVLPFSLGFLESLTDLSLCDLPILKCLPDSFGLLTKLKKLHLLKCGIEYLPQDLIKLNDLEFLSVRDCPVLELPFKKIERDLSNDKYMLGLKVLELRSTKISEVAFPKGVCPNLQTLSLRYCEELRQTTGLCGPAELQKLDISYCANIELVSLETLISLEDLSVIECERLKGIRALGQFTNLRRLYVSHCPEIQNMPTVEHLEEMTVVSCWKLKSIPGLGQLTKLRCLRLSECPNIQKLPSVQHLISMEELSISPCRNIKSIQGLGHLTKLRLLDVSCCEIQELPSVERLIWLEELMAVRTHKLKGIQGLGQLKKLRRLSINSCLEIQELPGVEHCSSLKELDARNCPSLQWGEGVLEQLAQRLKVLISEGFVDLHIPKLIDWASEGGSFVFKLDYKGQPACLPQSPQLHKHMPICADFGRAFEIGSVFRAEDSFTHRNLCEFRGLDMEMERKGNYFEVLDILDKLFITIFDGLNENYKKELHAINH